MSSVMGVLGPLEGAELGNTLVHEHALFDLTSYFTVSPDDPDASQAYAPFAESRREWLETHPMNSLPNLAQQDLAVAAAELRPVVRAGGRTLVDQSSTGLTPRPDALVTLANETGLNIIAGTGFYVAGSFPDDHLSMSTAEIADYLRRDLLAGIGGTDVRAGIIGELGISDPISPFELRVLEAAAIVQAEVGCAVSIHPPWGTEAVLSTARHMIEAGLDPARTTISHLDNRFTGDLVSFQIVLGLGFFVSFDCFGRTAYYPHAGVRLPTDGARIADVVALAEAGSLERLLFSQDICFEHELGANGGHGYAHVFDHICPKLRDAGLPQSSIETILVSNPRAWLTGDR